MSATGAEWRGNGGPGRPAGASAETLERRRRVQGMRSAGLSPAMIAECENCSEAYVRVLLKSGQADQNGEARSASESDPPATESPTRQGQLRPLSRRTLMDRAWTALNFLPFKLVDDAMQMAWLKSVMAIHDCGDGTELTFAPRSLFNDFPQFARALGRTEAEVTKLFDQGLLLELGDGGGIALPHHFNLRPKEKRRRPSERFEIPLIRDQREMLHVLSGGRSDATEIPTPAQPKPLYGATEIPSAAQPKSMDDATEIAANGATEINLQRSRAEKGTTTTTIKTLESLESGGGGGTFLSVSPAHESATEIPPSAQLKPPSDATEIPPDPAVQLAAEVAALCGYGTPGRADVDIVREWRRFPGVTDELILAAVRSDRAKPNPPPVYRLALFTAEIRGALSQAKAAAEQAQQPSPAPVVLPPPPSRAQSPSPEAVLKEALSNRWDRWRDAGNRGPMPPLIDAFRPYLGKSQEAAAHRWLAIFDAWHGAGRPHDARPPEFAEWMRDTDALEAEMLACEDALRAGDAGE